MTQYPAICLFVLFEAELEKPGLVDQNSEHFADVNLFFELLEVGWFGDDVHNSRHYLIHLQGIFVHNFCNFGLQYKSIYFHSNIPAQKLLPVVLVAYVNSNCNRIIDLDAAILKSGKSWVEQVVCLHRFIGFIPQQFHIHEMDAKVVQDVPDWLA